ncbi:MAG: hypothetical protein PHR56_02930 [Dehalococcoidales bacterium]|nr:hypothetical protein [Dehalococcoidales bacterium]
MNNPMTETVDELAYYKTFQKYLMTQVEVGEPVPVIGKPNISHHKIKITASNTAPTIGWPRIVFTGVGLSIANPNSISPTRLNMQIRRPESTIKFDDIPWHSDEKAQQLSTTRYERVSGQQFSEFTESERQQGEILYPGQSVCFELEVSSKVIPYLSFRIDSTISRRNLFHQEHVIEIPDTYTQPLVVEAFRAFNSIEFHQTLRSIITSMPAFNNETTLANIQTFAGELPQAMANLKGIQTNINEIFHKYEFPWLQAHLRAGFVYLDQIHKALANMQEALASNKQENIIERAKAIKMLEKLALVLNQETEALMLKYNISDENANYRYRSYRLV